MPAPWGGPRLLPGISQSLVLWKVSLWARGVVARTVQFWCSTVQPGSDCLAPGLNVTVNFFVTICYIVTFCCIKNVSFFLHMGWELAWVPDLIYNWIIGIGSKKELCLRSVYLKAKFIKSYIAKMLTWQERWKKTTTPFIWNPIMCESDICEI